MVTEDEIIMKKFLAILMTVVMLVSLTSCSVKMPANLPIENAITSLPESVTLDQTDVWPENAYTENVPQPTGKVVDLQVHQDLH